MVTRQWVSVHYIIKWCRVFFFGQQVPLKQKREEAAQHRGYGKGLLREAEHIAREEYGARRLIVLSGTGAREYYRSEFGYGEQAGYMVAALGPQA